MRVVPAALGAGTTVLPARSERAVMGTREALAARLGTTGTVALVLGGGVLATWGLFAVGAAVWYGLLPPVAILVALVVVFLLVALVVPVPDAGPDPDLPPAWDEDPGGGKPDEWDPEWDE
jgi:hypothetical protein